MVWFSLVYKLKFSNCTLDYIQGTCRQTAHPYLADAEFVEIVIVAQNGYFVRHCSTYTRPILYLKTEHTQSTFQAHNPKALDPFPLFN